MMIKTTGLLGILMALATGCGANSSDKAAKNDGALAFGDEQGQEVVVPGEDQGEVKPTEPVTPEQPVEPGQPQEPVKPTEPEQPTQPEQPVTPEQPVKPTEPTQPQQPTQPTQPQQPVTPQQPVKPTEPTQPQQPVTPEQPGQEEQQQQQQQQQQQGQQPEQQQQQEQQQAQQGQQQQGQEQQGQEQQGGEEQQELASAESLAEAQALFVEGRDAFFAGIEMKIADLERNLADNAAAGEHLLALRVKFEELKVIEADEMLVKKAALLIDSIKELAAEHIEG